MKEKMHVHFMGIGGSGMSAAASIALAQGYQVSGCDLLGPTPYTKSLEKNGVKIFTGHHSDHLGGVDLLTVTDNWIVKEGGELPDWDQSVVDRIGHIRSAGRFYRGKKGSTSVEQYKEYLSKL